MEVPHRQDIVMAIQGTIVEIHLRIQRDPLPSPGEDKGIDLRQEAILLGKGTIQPSENTSRLSHHGLV